MNFFGLPGKGIEVVASFADWLKVSLYLEITYTIDDLRVLQIRPFDHAYDGQKVVIDHGDMLRLAASTPAFFY